MIVHLACPKAVLYTCPGNVIHYLTMEEVSERAVRGGGFY